MSSLNMILSFTIFVYFFYRELQFDGVTLATDDFFYRGSKYEYDAGKIGEAHDWNQRRGEDIDHYQDLYSSQNFLHLIIILYAQYAIFS